MIGNTLIFFWQQFQHFPGFITYCYECLLVICCSLSNQSIESNLFVDTGLWFTDCCIRKRTEFFFLSFPLLLCLKLVRSGRLSPPWPTMVLVRDFICGDHHVCRVTLRTLSPLIRLYLIEPLGSPYLSTWNEPDVITAAAAASPW